MLYDLKFTYTLCLFFISFDPQWFDMELPTIKLTSLDILKS